MDRINNIGKTLLQYKTELLKHYSAIVDDSLMIALENQMDKKILTKIEYDLIINDNISVQEFEKHLLNKKEYIKSSKELLNEFEIIRDIVNKSLIDINFVDFIETESNIEAGKISILRQYTITDEFIKVYFGLEDKDMEMVMRKKGFAEKFAVLRLTKIFKEIFSESRPDIDYTQGFSKVYYNNDYNGFSIDYKYHLNVDNITTENIENKLKKIRETDKFIERKFVKKTSMQFYNIKTVEPIKNSLDLDKNNPINKTKEIEIQEQEISNIKEQLNDNLNDEKEIVKNNEDIIEIKENTIIKDESIVSDKDFFEVAETLIQNKDNIDKTINDENTNDEISIESKQIETLNNIENDFNNSNDMAFDDSDLI